MFSKCVKSRPWTNVLSPSAPKIGRNTPLLLYIHAHMQIVNWEGEMLTVFLCCSSLSPEPSLKNKFPGPPPQHFHLLDHSWKCSRDFSITQVLQVLEVDFRKGKFLESPCGSPCCVEEQHGWAPTLVPACQTDTSQGLL